MVKGTAQNIVGEREKFHGYLLTSGLKVTRGRSKVFEEAMKTHGHFTAEDLVKICQTKRLNVSRATIYRSLRELLEAGVVRKTAFGEKHDHYEHVYDEKPHHHARCIRCFDVIEFPDLKEDKIYVPFLQEKGFHILGHEMHFYGICKTCQEPRG